MKPFVMYGRVTSGCDVWRSGEEPRSSVDVCFPERLSFGLPAVSISLSLSRRLRHNSDWRTWLESVLC